MKIVVAYALAGIGHKKAAEALHAVCLRGGHESRLVDALDYSTGLTRWLYPRLYLFLIACTPRLWGAGYALADARWVQPLLRPLRRLVNGAAAGRLARWLSDTQPETILVTHFLPAEVASALKRAGRLRARLVVVVTDLHPHALWIVPGADAYAVADEATRQALLARGVPETRIHVTGIPIDARFAALPSQEEARRHFGLASDRRLILVTGGGFGVGPMRQIVERLVRDPALETAGAQVAVVCGRNPALVQTLERLAPGCRVPLRVFGFLEEMPALMAASDLLVAKPGGLTVTEALAAGLPMILYGAIPGQETFNERFLVAAEVAVAAGTPGAIQTAVLRFLQEPQRLSAFRRRIACLAHPEAAARIVTALADAP